MAVEALHMRPARSGSLRLWLMAAAVLWAVFYAVIGFGWLEL